MLKQWTRFEKIWLGTFAFLILSATVIFSIMYTDYSSTKSIVLNWIISPVSALTGILCVVLVARGSIWNYAWGVVNCISYGYIAYNIGYYGDFVINIFYFLPFQFIGFIWWRHHFKSGSNEYVKMRRLSFKQLLYILGGGILATFAVGYALFTLDHWFTNTLKRSESIYQYIDSVTHIKFLGSIFDASTEILQIIAQLLMTFAYAEQWLFWILTNIITITMWTIVLVADPTTIAWVLPTTLTWVAFLINAIYGHYNWIKGAKQNV